MLFILMSHRQLTRSIKCIKSVKQFWVTREKKELLLIQLNLASLLQFFKWILQHFCSVTFNHLLFEMFVAVLIEIWEMWNTNNEQVGFEHALHSVDRKILELLLNFILISCLYYSRITLFNSNWLLLLFFYFFVFWLILCVLKLFDRINIIWNSVDWIS